MRGDLLVFSVIGGAILVSGLWLRTEAAHQWDLTQRFYQGHGPVLARLDDLHHRVRAASLGRVSMHEVQQESAKLVADLEHLNPPNGRTIRTQDAELAYARDVADWAKRVVGGDRRPASPSFTDLEVDWGALLGQVTLEDHSYAFQNRPAPGTMPSPTPKRII